MSRLTYAFLFCVFGIPLVAQDYSIQSLYRQAPLLLNPARAGLYDGTSLTVAYKRQLVGIEQGPNLQFLGFQQGISKQRVGLALNISQDNNGPLTTAMAEGIFAYHINYDNGRINKSDNYLSFGIAPSFKQYRLNTEMLSGALTDPVFALIDGTGFELNTAFGIFLYSQGLEVGFSAYNLIIGTAKTFSGLNKQYILPKGTLYLGVQYPVEKSIVVHPFLNFTAQFDGDFFADLNVDGRLSVNEQTTLVVGTGIRYAHQWDAGFPELLLLSGGLSFGPLSMAYQFNRPLSSGRGLALGEHIFSFGFSTFPMKGGESKSIKKPKSWFK